MEFANSADPEKMAPEGAIGSGSALIVLISLFLHSLQL